MKVKRIQWLPTVSIVFAVFIIGLFCVRNLHRTPSNSYILRSESGTSGIVSVSAEAESKAAQTEPAQSVGPLNLNTATLEQLDALPGIGPVLAQSIIDYRETNGPFSAVGELMNVSGIGEKKLEAIWDMVTAEGE